MLFNKNKVKYKGFLTLKSSNKQTLKQITNDILFFSNNCFLNKKVTNQTTQTKTNKYITIFKSPFVYKKAKDTFLCTTYSSTINFEISNFLVLKLLVLKLENFKGHIDSTIKVSSTLSEHETTSVKFGTEHFKKLITQ